MEAVGRFVCPFIKAVSQHNLCRRSRETSKRRAAQGGCRIGNPCMILRVPFISWPAGLIALALLAAPIHEAPTYGQVASEAAEAETGTDASPAEATPAVRGKIPDKNLLEILKAGGILMIP